jgi:hypothetical protein
MRHLLAALHRRVFRICDNHGRRCSRWALTVMDEKSFTLCSACVLQSSWMTLMM